MRSDLLLQRDHGDVELVDVDGKKYLRQIDRRVCRMSNGDSNSGEASNKKLMEGLGRIR